MLKSILSILESREAVIDSKKANENTIFFAINKGNDYVLEALNKGSIVVCDKSIEKHENIYHVNNTIDFMKLLASKWRENLKTKIIGITGSNGKTSVKDILYDLLSLDGKCYKTQGNYNNHIGMSLTLMNVKSKYKYAVVEIGTSNFGEIKELSKIANPDYSVITNIGQSHMEFFKTEENVYLEKISIADFTKEKVYVNYQDKYLKNFNKGEFANCLNFYSEFKSYNGSTNFILNINDKKYELSTNLIGQHNILNITLALKVVLDITKKDISFFKDKLLNLSISPMRMQVIKHKGVTIINDAYNASPKSMIEAILTMELFKEKKVFILSDMLELGENSINYHIGLKEYLKNEKDIIILYGEKMKYLYNALDRKNIYYVDNKSKIQEILSNITKPYIILLKGSRGMKLEEILDDLKGKN